MLWLGPTKGHQDEAGVQQAFASLSRSNIRHGAGDAQGRSCRKNTTKTTVNSRSSVHRYR